MIESVRIPIIKRSLGYFLRWYYNGWHYWHFYPGALNYKTEGEKHRTYGTRSVTMSSGPLTEAQVEAVRTILNTREVYLFTDNGWAAVRIETGQAEIMNTLTTGCEVTFKAIIGSRMLSVTGFSPVADVPVSEPDDLCEVTIGTQIWMCKNWDADYPASKVYNNDEANRAIYGGLYSYDQIRSAGFVPEGWHIPTVAEINTLCEYLGDVSGVGIGGKLKETGTDYWNSPNTGADNSTGLSIKGSGFYGATMSGMVFSSLKEVADIWAIGTDPTRAYVFNLNYDDADLSLVYLSVPNTYMMAVRLLKNVASDSSVFTDWFLPSRNELQQMYLELHVYSQGSFANDYYWSSMEGTIPNASINARAANFTTGVFQNALKGSTYRVRACRKFTGNIGDYVRRDIGPAGGYIFYILPGGTEYYEAAPSDQTSSQWSNVVNMEVGTCEFIGCGENNTLSIIGQIGHTTSAAKICNDLIVSV